MENFILIMAKMVLDIIFQITDKFTHIQTLSSFFCTLKCFLYVFYFSPAHTPTYTTDFHYTLLDHCLLFMAMNGSY